ncbi:MAG: PAS domain S-box protein [Chitinophagaceae bacterium]|nr:PAS domain S-box protein [Chitinophagaceae bacterium]
MRNNNSFRPQIMDHKIPWIFGFALVALILFLSVVYKQTEQQKNTRNWVDLSNQTIKKIDTIGILLSEAETAATAFALTKDSDWVTRVYQLQFFLNQSVADLQKLTADNRILQYNLQKLQQLCFEKEVYQKEFLSGSLSNEELLKRMSPQGKGQQISRSIKILLGSIRETTKALLTNRMLQNEASYHNSIYTALIGGVFAFFLGLVILFLLNRDIHLQKKNEEAIAVSELKYRSITENAGVVMYTTDINGLITFANNQITNLTGYTLEELSGQHFSMLLDPGGKEAILRFYINQYKNKLAATTLEILIRTKSGMSKWVEQSAQLIFDRGRVTGFQCMTKDITEKKLVAQELNQSEASRKENEYRLNAILDNSTALIYIKDLNGRYVMINKKFKTFFNVTEEMVIGRTDYDFNLKEQADHYKKNDEEVLASLKPIESEEIIHTASGSKNLLLLKFPLLSPDKVLLGVSGIASDITHEAVMREQSRLALQKAESAQQIQEQFLANMSHEIRTPMNGIQGMTKLLLETHLSEEQKKFTAIISKSLNNLVVIVNNVLDFSNLKAGKLTFDNFAFDLVELLNEVKKYFEHPLKNKGLSFHLSIGEGVPQFVKGDAFRLKQILTNLIDNAIKFTDSGHIDLLVEVNEKLEKFTDMLFSLSDTGIGIPKDKLNTIFESFAQAGKNISSGYGGAGLGLTISKGLIELQGGAISVKSNHGEGSVFTFHLSFGISQNQDIVSSQSDYAERLAGKRILVVEDNQVNQRLIDFVLKKVNISVDLASNGKEAIKLCEKNPPYDLIIMDLQMPVMDGYETTIYLREQMNLQTPIVAMTATALKEDQERSYSVGMNDFMIKPFDFNDLYSRMIRLLYNTTESPADQVQQKNEKEALFDLSLIRELDDDNYLIEVVEFFLDNTPTDFKELAPLAANKDWDALYKKAHKVKGAAGMLQSTKLAAILATIESNARHMANTEKIPELVQEATELFSALQKALRKELDNIKNGHT